MQYENLKLPYQAHGWDIGPLLAYTFSPLDIIFNQGTVFAPLFFISSHMFRNIFWLISLFTTLTTMIFLRNKLRLLHILENQNI